MEFSDRCVRNSAAAQRRSHGSVIVIFEVFESGVVAGDSLRGQSGEFRGDVRLRGVLNELLDLPPGSRVSWRRGDDDLLLLEDNGLDGNLLNGYHGGSDDFRLVSNRNGLDVMIRLIVDRLLVYDRLRLNVLLHDGLLINNWLRLYVNKWLHVLVDLEGGLVDGLLIKDRPRLVVYRLLINHWFLLLDRSNGVTDFLSLSA